MLFTLARRLLAEPDPRAVCAFLYKFGWKGMRAVNAFMRRRARGEHFPAFTFISVTNRCNLRCRGCWATGSARPRDMDAATLAAIIAGAKARGATFFGILGGEPLLYPGLLDVFAAHRDGYFLLFTNGILLDDAAARRLRALGNVSPLVSIEGRAEESDRRRGGVNVYARSMAGLECCRRHRLVTGVATSVCKSNIEDLASEKFVNELARRGVHYLWYYIYRPSGPDPAYELALSGEEVRRLRQFIVDVRRRAPLMIVDAYWDHDGKALCPAAVGIAHHIAPSGLIEPCPPIQFAGDEVRADSDLHALYTRSRFLARFRDTACAATRGCILMEKPAALERLVREENAVDSSGRGTGLAELAARAPCPSHDVPGAPIPETSWFYRFAKKHWFFGFGAYG